MHMNKCATIPNVAAYTNFLNLVFLPSVRGNFIFMEPYNFSVLQESFNPQDPEFFLTTKRSFVLYGSLYKDSSNSLSPGNFILPLPWNIWLWFLISFLFGAVFLYCLQIFISETVEALTVSAHFVFFKSFSTLYKLIVEQEGSLCL